MGNYTIFLKFENPRRGRQARNFSENDPKILDLKSSSKQIIFRKLSLGAPAITFISFTYVNATIKLLENWIALSMPRVVESTTVYEALKNFRVLTDINIKTLRPNISAKTANHRPYS